MICDDQQIAMYQYDPFGRRFSKRVNSETTYYLYSDEGLIAELNEQGKIDVAYGWEPNSMWGTSRLWQANLTTGQTLQSVDYHYLHTYHIGTPQIATKYNCFPTCSSASFTSYSLRTEVRLIHFITPDNGGTVRKYQLTVHEF